MQGPVEARVTLVVPEERQVSGVEFRVGEQVQAVLQRPPWRAEIAVPAPESVGELIYLTVTATLDDGTSAEDVRILTASGITEKVEEPATDAAAPARSVPHAQTAATAWPRLVILTGSRAGRPGFRIISSA